MFKERENAINWVKDTTKARNASAVSMSSQPARNDRELRLSEREKQNFMASNPGFAGQIDFHYLVVDKLSALSRYIRRGCTIAVEPFESNLGRCAVVQDSSGVRFCILDKGDAPFVSKRM